MIAVVGIVVAYIACGALTGRALVTFGPEVVEGDGIVIGVAAVLWPLTVVAVILYFVFRPVYYWMIGPSMCPDCRYMKGPRTERLYQAGEPSHHRPGCPRLKPWEFPHHDIPDMGGLPGPGDPGEL